VRLRDLATRLSCRLDGDGDIEVYRLAGIEQAGPGDLTFFANARYAPALRTTRASAVILAAEAPAAPCAMLRAADPYLAFANAVPVFAPPPTVRPGIDGRSVIADGVRLGRDLSIGPFVVIEEGAIVGDRTVIRPNTTIAAGATIGHDCAIGAGVSIRERCQLGDRVVVHDGAVIGSDGFGFVRRADGSYQKIPQTSVVILEDDVEVGANTTIDRPAIGETRICAGTKIDNLVQIAHGVKVGRNTMLASQVGIAGSVTIGSDVLLAGQVGVAGHVKIGDRTKATAQTGIPNSVAEGSFLSGYPAIDNRDWLKASAVFRRLPALKKLVAELEQRIGKLEARRARRRAKAR
jgi:UDP-3-O-[3-hydroxymyristoyl] glucosamine N-acyltransferase